MRDALQLQKSVVIEDVARHGLFRGAVHGYTDLAQIALYHATSIYCDQE